MVNIQLTELEFEALIRTLEHQPLTGDESFIQDILLKIRTGKYYKVEEFKAGILSESQKAELKKSWNGVKSSEVNLPKPGSY